MFPHGLIEVITRVSPALAAALGGPIGGVVGSLISTVLGGIDMSNTEEVAKALENPDSVNKLKQLELQLNDLQNARLQAQNDKGASKLIRPLMAIIAMIAIFVDIYAIENVSNPILNQILIVMLVILVWDIRQIYKFYFGSSDDPPYLSFLKKKK